MIFQYIVYILSGVLFFLIIAKTVLFLFSTSHKTVIKYFYFGTLSIHNSRDEKSRKAKLLQNTLSTIIAFLAVLDVMLIFLFRIGG